MKTINFIIAFICAVGVAACFDAIMNHVMVTSFIGDDWLNKSARILTYIGRAAFGWFICAGIIFKHVREKLND